MIRYKTFDSTGIATGGRLYAADLNAIQDAAAGLTDLAQNISVNSLIVGEVGLILSRFGAGEAQVAGALRSTGIFRGLGGLVPGTFTTTTRNAIAAGGAPTGIIIYNSTTAQFEWNSGSDGARVWKPLGFDAAGDLVLTGGGSSLDFTDQTAANYPFTAKRTADTVPRIAVKEDGAIEWGAGGVSARDVLLSRIGADRLGMGASDKFVLSSAGIEFSDASTLTSGLISRIGVLASRPAANSVQAGTTYFATDQMVDYISDGSTWYRKSDPAGTVASWYLSSGAAPTGWVVYDGTSLPASTGIYADLYAHLGNSVVTPDTRGRMEVAKGTHVDVDTVGENDGLAVGSRRPKHKHTVGNPTISSPAITITDPQHQHTQGSSNADGADAYNRISSGNMSDNWQSYDEWRTGLASTGITAALASAPVASGGTVGPQTGSEPTDSEAYIVTVKIAKL